MTHLAHVDASSVREGNQYAYRDTLAFDMLPEGWEPVK
jgi:hypothetical protein